MRFRIRTILIITAIAAALVTLVPKALNRYRVSVALNTVLEKGRVARHSPEWNYLATDQPRVLQRLMQVLEAADESGERRINASETIMSLLEVSPSFRDPALPQLTAVAIDPKDAWLRPRISQILVRLIPSHGIADYERKQIYERAASLLEHRDGSPVIDWLRVLIVIGGQDELQLIVRYFYTLSPAEKAIVCNLLTRQLSEDLLPAGERWIYDPECAEYALQLDVLSLTKSGRSALLRFALDSSQPSAMRLKALKQLQQTVAGLDLLDVVLANQTQADDLSKLMEADCKASWEAERAAILNAQYGEDFWAELIDGTDSNYFVMPASPNVKVSSEQQARDQKSALQKSQLSLDLLRRLSGRKEIKAQADWQAWHAEGQKPAELRQILEAVLEHPELLGISSILRRMVPYHLAEIPADCLPLYQQMLASDNPALKYWASKALLHFSDDPDAINVAIDLIEKDQPERANQSLGWRSGTIPLLSERFGVNYFWDTNAWREWAKSRRDMDTSR